MPFAKRSTSRVTGGEPVNNQEAPGLRNSNDYCLKQNKQQGGKKTQLHAGPALTTYGWSDHVPAPELWLYVNQAPPQVDVGCYNVNIIITVLFR